MYNRRMIPLRALNAHPHYADLFDEVPFLLWPILWWQLNAMIRWMRDAHVTDVCFQTNWCGFITIRFAAYAEAPDLYKPIPRVFRALSDPSWETSLPANLALDAPSIWHALNLPCEAGAFRDQKSHGDFPGKESGTLFPNTS
jgi:hypothetical protein